MNLDKIHIVLVYKPWILKDIKNQKTLCSLFL